MPRPTKFSPEVRERAVRMVYEIREAHASQWSAIEAVARKIGCPPPPDPEQQDARGGRAGPL